MSVPEEIGKYISKMYCTIKNEAAFWLKTHNAEMAQFAHDKAVAEKELKQRLARMDIRFAEECNRIRMEEELQTEHFGEFLASIDEMKVNMLTYYANMPKPIALMIHHHAAELLKEAWHSQDARERLKKQTAFTNLMLTITEDLTELQSGGIQKALPEKTIAFIQSQDV